MPLHAHEFFTHAFPLPLKGATVIGATFYAHPDLASRLRLRIDFAPTARVREYRGLRLTVTDPEYGELDRLTLKFADHRTFRSRDLRCGRRPGSDGYGVIRDWHEDTNIPWAGGDFAALRAAVASYVAVWFPAAQPFPLTVPVIPAQPNRDAS